jgi:pilus assembly protein Flp/PilA
MMMKNPLGKWRRIRDRFFRFHFDDSGQDLIEYALIAALIALSAVIGMGSVAKALNDIFSSVGSKITSYII